MAQDVLTVPERAVTTTGSLRAQRLIGRFLAYGTLIFFSILFAFPLTITIGDSLKGFQEIYEAPRTWIPRDPQWSNYVDIFTSGIPFHRFFLNTILITAMSLTGTVCSSILVGYSFGRLRWPFRNFFFIVLLSTMMLPGQVTMIPIFLMFTKLNWVGTWAPLIVPAYFGGGVFNIFLMRQFFKTIPTALEDAAKIDGCSQIRILLQIMVPLAKPAIATICVLGFIAGWNDFMGPLIYLQDFHIYPISLGIWMFRDAEVMFPHYIMAASLVAVLPVLVIFFCAQSYFVKGIVMSGIKG